MPLQELFDRSVRGVLAQGRPSVRSDGMCLYRGLDGAKCGVGHLITDDCYDTKIELRRADSSVVMESLICSLGTLDRQQRHFIADLQAAHDEAASAGDGEFFTAMLPRKVFPAPEFLTRYKKACLDLAFKYGLNPETVA